MAANEETELKQGTRASFTYNDIIQMESDAAYRTIGKVISSQKPSAPTTVFGTAEKKNQDKILAEEPFMKLISGGKEGQGPAAYLPSRYFNEEGEEIQRPDQNSELKYNSIPSFSIGKSLRKGQENPIYNYMNSKNDDIRLDSADLKRRKSNPCIRIGTEKRFHSEKKNKITPGPTYDPHFRPDMLDAPKYTFRLKMSLPGSDPLVPNSKIEFNAAGTTSLVGPNTYFQRGVKSHSTSSLNRVPHTSKIRNEPVISFTKGPKTLTGYKNSVDETYDLKNKTIMAHYDFEYDGGKGLHSGRGWEKNQISKCSQGPLERNKMKSFTMARSSREKEKQRGTFVSMMSQVPSSVRINHPKF